MVRYLAGGSFQNPRTTCPYNVRIIDPGHQYALKHIDGDGEEIITYVKREGDKYPGNSGHHPGTNLQEEWRAQIDRLKYLDMQKPHWANKRAIKNLRENIEALEQRAAEAHGRHWQSSRPFHIENEPVCDRCGHIECGGSCHR